MVLFIYIEALNGTTIAGLGDGVIEFQTGQRPISRTDIHPN
jgi:hypothetical protein